MNNNTWRKEKLSKVAQIIMGQSPASSTYNITGDGLPFYQGKSDFGFMYPSIRMFCSVPLKIAFKNDIFMSVRAPVGPVNLCNTDSCIGRGLAAIRAKQNTDYRFLYYYLMYIKPLIEILGTGSIFHAINKSKIENLEIKNPSLSEQRKIAVVLSTVQKAIETQTKLIERTTELKKAMMHKLFTEGTRGEKQKMTEIGLVPESWEMVELGSIPVKMFGGGTPSTNIKEYWNGDIEWTTSKRLEEGKIFISKGEKKITLSGLNDSSSKLVPKNSLIISTRVTVGKVAINKIDLAISQDLTGLIIDSSRFSLEFIAFQILTDRVQKIFDSRKRGATIKGITREDLKSIRILLPPIHEQHDISNCLLSIDRKIDHHIAKKQKLEELFRALLHQLMTAEIRVNDIDLSFLEGVE